VVHAQTPAQQVSLTWQQLMQPFVVHGLVAALLLVGVLAGGAAVGGVVLSVASNTRPSVCVVAISTGLYATTRTAAALRRRARRKGHPVRREPAGGRPALALLATT